MTNVLLALNNKDMEIYMKQQLKECQVVASIYYREAIMEKLERLHDVNVVVIRETLQGSADIFDIVYQIRVKYPSVRIIFIAVERMIGDVNLSKLVSYGVYDIVVGREIDVKEVIDLVRKPKTFADSQRYQVEGVKDLSRNVGGSQSVEQPDKQPKKGFFSHFKKPKETVSAEVDVDVEEVPLSDTYPDIYIPPKETLIVNQEIEHKPSVESNPTIQPRKQESSKQPKLPHQMDTRGISSPTQKSSLKPSQMTQNGYPNRPVTTGIPPKSPIEQKKPSISAKAEEPKKPTRSNERFMVLEEEVVEESFIKINPKEDTTKHLFAPRYDKNSEYSNSQNTIMNNRKNTSPTGTNLQKISEPIESVSISTPIVSQSEQVPYVNVEKTTRMETVSVPYVESAPINTQPTPKPTPAPAPTPMVAEPAHQEKETMKPPVPYTKAEKREDLVKAEEPPYIPKKESEDYLYREKSSMIDISSLSPAIANKQKIISFISGVDGVGCSSIAFNTAINIASQPTGKKTYPKVMFLELDDHFSSVGYTYRLDYSEVGIDKALKCIADGNYQSLKNTIVGMQQVLATTKKEDEMYSIYRKMPMTLDFMLFSRQYREKKSNITINEECLKELILYFIAKEGYDYIIVDIGSRIHTKLAEISLNLSTQVYSVMNQGVTSVASLLQTKTLLEKKKITIDERLFYVLNKQVPKIKPNVKNLENWLHQDIDFVINYSSDFIRAEFEGEPIVFTKNKEIKNAFDSIKKQIIT